MIEEYREQVAKMESLMSQVKDGYTIENTNNLNEGFLRTVKEFNKSLQKELLLIG